MHFESCSTLNCKQCAADAKLRTIAKRSHTLRLGLALRICEGVSNADLERIAQTFPNLLPEAVRELNGEVEYIQHNLNTIDALMPLPKGRV
jgi:hypothetical protein